MIRIPLLAFASIFLSATLVANEPASKPANELETTAIQVAMMAYQVGDYETVETLFDKLSLESQKGFLQKAVEMSKMPIPAELPQTFLDMAFFTHYALASHDPKGIENAMKLPEQIENWAEEKQKQTQLLGRLTLSLFEQAKKDKPHVATYPPVAVPRPFEPAPPQFLKPESERQIVVLSEKPFASFDLTGKEHLPHLAGCYFIGPDGYITLGSYGRIYVEGLSADECRDAIEFYLSKHAERSRTAGNSEVILPESVNAQWSGLTQRLRTENQTVYQRPESERKILRWLEMPVTLNEEQILPLEKALQILGRQVEISMYLDERALAEANASANTMVRMRRTNSDTARNVLNSILDHHDLAFVVKNEMLNITTKNRARGEKIVRMYYVQDIRDATDGKLDFDILRDMITTGIDPESWEVGDAVLTLHGTTQSLVIRHFEDVHAQVEELLNQIREKNGQPKEERFNMKTFRNEAERFRDKEPPPLAVQFDEYDKLHRGQYDESALRLAKKAGELTLDKQINYGWYVEAGASRMSAIEEAWRLTPQGNFWRVGY